VKKVKAKAEVEVMAEGISRPNCRSGCFLSLNLDLSPDSLMGIEVAPDRQAEVSPV